MSMIKLENMAMASHSLAKPMIPVAVFIPLTRGIVRARRGFGGYIAGNRYTSPTPFRIFTIVSCGYTMERPRRKFSKPPVNVVCLVWSGFILWVLDIPLFCSPLSKILRPSQASRFAAMERLQERKTKHEALLRKVY